MLFDYNANTTNSALLEQFCVQNVFMFVRVVVEILEVYCVVFDLLVVPHQIVQNVYVVLVASIDRIRLNLWRLTIFKFVTFFLWIAFRTGEIEVGCDALSTLSLIVNPNLISIIFEK